MPRLNSSNNAESTLVSAITATATNLRVSSAASFPNAPFRVTIDGEIIEVGYIDKAANTFSQLLRGQEGTTAASHSAGATVQNRFTSGTYDELLSESEFNSYNTENNEIIDSRFTSVNESIQSLGNDVQANTTAFTQLDAGLSHLQGELEVEKTVNKARIFRHSRTNQAVPSYSYATPVRFPYQLYNEGFTNDNDTYTKIPKDGVYFISSHVGIGSLFPSGGNTYCTMDFNFADGRTFRTTGQHYNFDGNFGVNGALVLYLKAGDSFRVRVGITEAYDIIGTDPPDIRTWVSVHEL